MRIDAHVHYTPPAMRDDLAALAVQEPYWNLLMTASGAGQAAQGWATAERMIDDMDRAGIDRVVLLSEYRLTHESSVARNDQALHILRRWPDRVMAFACLQPTAGQAALDEMKRCLDSGMVGVGELNPYGQAHTLDDPDFLRVVEACITYGVPMNLHVSEEIGHYYLGKSTTPLRHYHRLACRYPELKLILAHWGGGLFLYEIMPEVRRELANVWYDTAASPLLYPTQDIFDVALRCVDRRKILYGSDYPLSLYPGRQAEPDFCAFVTEIEGLGLAPEVLEDLLGGNAARLLGLAETQAATRPSARKPRRSLVTTELADPTGVAITDFMAVTLVARTWPETQAVFERYGIPCVDSPVPFWEPIAQAAAAKGLGPQQRQRLLTELNEAAGRL